MRGFANLELIRGLLIMTLVMVLGVGIAPNYLANDTPNQTYAIEIAAPTSLEPLDACTIIQQWHCTAWEDRRYASITFGDGSRQAVRWKRVDSSPYGAGWVTPAESFRDPLRPGVIVKFHPR